MIAIKVRQYGLIMFSILFFYDCANNAKSESFQVVMVKRRDIGKTVLATGIIKPKVGAEVRVGSRVSGIVKKLYVQIGDYVVAHVSFNPNSKGTLNDKMEITHDGINQPNPYVIDVKGEGRGVAQFTNPGNFNWTVPAGVTKVKVLVVRVLP